jgi:hypothetical protein
MTALADHLLDLLGYGAPIRAITSCLNRSHDDTVTGGILAGLCFLVPYGTEAQRIHALSFAYC